MPNTTIFDPKKRYILFPIFVTTKSAQGSYDAFHTSLDLVDEHLAGKEMQKIGRYVPAASQNP